MGKIREGQKRHQLTLDEESEIYQDLTAYAEKRGLTNAQANRCILADWSDAYRGKPNPFAAYMPLPSGASPSLHNGTAHTDEEETQEERERRAKEKAALSQFD